MVAVKPTALSNDGLVYRAAGVVFALLAVLTASVPAISADPFPSTPQNECPVQAKRVTVRGTSLSGFIAPGQTITVLSGYYACHDPQPDDVVIYLYGGVAANDPLIKIVKGVPGDKVSFRKAEGAWSILVNGKPLRTTTGIPYAIAGGVFDAFSRYVNEANGVIPQDEYLVLGNLPAGSIDSTRFGFVQKPDLAGKVEK